MDNINPSLLVGGVGLFLLGMMLMTDGLKMAAGPALGRILNASTQTRLRGLLSGILITALVQSSSAVTVAAIGFVNAGLLRFGQSLWVLFGANVGTTMTAWLVALIGFKVDVDAMALPMIGVGMALRLSGAGARRGAAGNALAGFGVLFLGISFLQQSISGTDQLFDPTLLNSLGALSVIAFLLGGLLLTTLMQSSSAALAVILTLAQSHLLPLQEAAAAVIGANIGTTVTALLAVIGATPNAKRAAFAHVLFNVITGLVALLLLSQLVNTVDLLRQIFGMDSSPAISLALFHSIFNILGVLIMWPLSDRLGAFLLGRFRTREEAISQPRFLDRNVASVPSLAVDALYREIIRVGGIGVGSVWARTGLLLAIGGRLDAGAGLPALVKAISDFVAQVSRAPMAADTAQMLAQLLRALRYYETCGELAPDIATGQAAIGVLADPALQMEVVDLARTADSLLTQLNPDSEPFAPLSAQQAEEFEAAYQHLKASLLTAGARGALDLEAMESLTRSFSTLRRAIDQAAKAARLLEQLRGGRNVTPTTEVAASTTSS